MTAGFLAGRRQVEVRSLAGVWYWMRGRNAWFVLRRGRRLGLTCGKDYDINGCGPPCIG